MENTMKDTMIDAKAMELIDLVRKVTKCFGMDSELRICGIQDNQIHFSDLSGFKKFVGSENFNKIIIKQDILAEKSNWIELQYVINEITVIVLI